MLEVIGFSLLLVLSIRSKGMNDKTKIEKIFEYAKVWMVSETRDKKKCKFIAKNNIEGSVGTEYIYSLPLGMPYKKLEYLNDNIGVFKDGLNKNVALDFKGGYLIVSVYESDLPKEIKFEEVLK